VVDGLKGFPEAIESVFPHAEIQTCIVHLIRYSMQFASWKERKHIAQALTPLSPPLSTPRKPWEQRSRFFLKHLRDANKIARRDAFSVLNPPQYAGSTPTSAAKKLSYADFLAGALT
jgi:hypothetical protein